MVGLTRLVGVIYVAHVGEKETSIQNTYVGVGNSERERRFLVGIIATCILKGGCRRVYVLSSEWGAIQESLENCN